MRRKARTPRRRSTAALRRPAAGTADLGALERFLRSIGIKPSNDPEYARTARLAGAFLAGRAAGLGAKPRPLRALRYRGRAGATVALEAIPVYGLCPHHLVPYFGTATVRYAPRGRVAGAGDLARLVRELARAPRLQEDLTEAVADELDRALAARSVEVRIEARHLCIEMRGVEQRAQFVTEARRGEAAAALAPVRRSGRATPPAPPAPPTRPARRRPPRPRSRRR